MTTLDLQQMEDYLAWMEEHGRRASTLRNRRATLRMLLRTLNEGGRETDVWRITPEDMIWLDQNLKVKESTRATYLDTLNGMIEHFTDRNVLRRAGILRNRSDESTNRVFITKDDFYTAYDAAPQEMRMALVLGAFMGLRRMEIASVRESEIDDGKIAVHGKGHGPDGLTVMVPLPKAVLEEMAAFKKYRQDVGVDTGDDHIFQLMDHNGRWHGAQPETVGYRMKALADDLGMRLTPHSLRRLYATTLYNECSVDLETLRRMMRHADVNTTLHCYVNADPQKVTAAMDALGEVLAL